MILPSLTKDLGYYEALKGLFLIGILMFFFWIVAKGNFGGGDMKLCALIGLYLGWSYGLGVILSAHLLSLLLIPVYLIKRVPLHTQFPLAPFYLMGFLLTILFWN